MKKEINSLKTDTEIAQNWHDHSLESSQGALSDGAISFQIVKLKTYWHDLDYCILYRDKDHLCMTV
jgi:hypothetical protein